MLEAARLLAEAEIKELIAVGFCRISESVISRIDRGGSREAAAQHDRSISAWTAQFLYEHVYRLHEGQQMRVTEFDAAQFPDSKKANTGYTRLNEEHETIEAIQYVEAVMFAPHIEPHVTAAERHRIRGVTVTEQARREKYIEDSIF